MHALAPVDGQVPPRIEPETLSDVFEVLTRAVFQAGMAWEVIDRRWPDFERALDGFDPYAVAAWGDRELDAVMAAPGIIRNRSKFASTVRNAATLVELEREHGSFAGWLAEHPGHDAAAGALRSHFSYLGSFGATWALHVLGEETPPHAEWSRLRPRGEPAG